MTLLEISPLFNFLNSFTNFLYNGDGVRIAEVQDGLRTDYVQDVAASLPQVLTAQQGGTVSKYPSVSLRAGLRGLGLIGEQTGGTGPNAAPAAWQYPLPNAPLTSLRAGPGSVRQIVDAQGQLQLTQRFDPFGGVMQQAATNGQRSAYGFAGEEQDSTTGQLFLRARTYNPATGRFLQSDPVMGRPSEPRTLHNYAYAFNNPVNFADPGGLIPPMSSTYANGAGTSPLPFTGYAAAPPRVGQNTSASLALAPRNGRSMERREWPGKPAATPTPASRARANGLNPAELSACSWTSATTAKVL